MTISWLCRLVCAMQAGIGWSRVPVSQPHDGKTPSAPSLEFIMQSSTDLLPFVSSSDIERAVQRVLNAQAEYWNISFSFGFTNAAGHVKLAAGINDIWSNPKQPMTADTPIPVGSTTKSWTAVAILQYAENGTLSLNDLASKWVDPVLWRLNRTKLATMFPGTESVTIGDLLSMSSGIGDYDDRRIAIRTFNHPGADVSPLDMLHHADKSLVCVPKTCVSYSSLGYELLGLALVNLQGVASWEDLDQFAIIPPVARRSGRYNNTVFPGRGPCRKHSRIAHQYSYSRYPYTGEQREVMFFDLFDNSCLNGWTCGNIASTGGDLANFYYDLFHGNGGPYELLNRTSLNQMLQFHAMSNTWCPGCLYGKGLIYGQSSFVFEGGSDAVKLNKTSMVGHPGQDWGSGAPWCGYNAYYQFSACLVTNANFGMNASLANQKENVLAPTKATCEVYNSILAVFGGPVLNCSVYHLPPPDWQFPASWQRQPPLPIPAPAPLPPPKPPPVSPGCLTAVESTLAHPLVVAAQNKVQKYDTQQLTAFAVNKICKSSLLSKGSCSAALPWQSFPLDIPVWQNVTTSVSSTAMLCSVDLAIHAAALPGYPVRLFGYRISLQLYSYFVVDKSACTPADGHAYLAALASALRAVYKTQTCDVTWTPGQTAPCANAELTVV